MKNVVFVFFCAFLSGSFYLVLDSQQKEITKMRETISKLISAKFEKGTSIAILKTTDGYGNPADEIPRVVCLAEIRGGKSLICRVESVR